VKSGPLRTRIWDEGGVGVLCVGVERNPPRLAFGAREGREEAGDEKTKSSHLYRGRGVVTSSHRSGDALRLVLKARGATPRPSGDVNSSDSRLGRGRGTGYKGSCQWREKRNKNTPPFRIGAREELATK